MELEVAGVESAAGVHETDEGRVEDGVGAKVELNVRETVVDGDRHRRKGRPSCGRKGFGEHQ